LTTDYSHSIRNRLFLTLGGDELEYTVTDNALKSLTQGTVTVTDEKMLREVCANTTPLNEIFSSVNITWVGNAFLCYPSVFNKAEDQKTLFAASHNQRDSEQLLNGAVNPDIGISYAVYKALFDVIKEKYPNVVYQHEMESFFTYVQTEIKPSSVAIVLARNETKTMIVVKDASGFRLLNQYDTKDLQDVFYFTMLAIEQLELDVQESSLYWLTSKSQNEFQEANNLFENYIQNIVEVSVSNETSTAMALAIACA
jgi:hypothetical protein